jgi:hypothetical protein
MKRMWMAGMLGLLVVAGALGQLSQSGGMGGSVTVTGGSIAVTSGSVAVTNLVSCDSAASISMTSATTTQAIALVSGKSVYVCGFLLNADGKTTARLVQGTGTNCATGQSNLTPPFNVDAGANVQLGSGLGRLLKSNAGSAVCVMSSAGKTLNVLLIYTQL